MTKNQFFAIDYETFIDIVESAAAEMQYGGKDLRDAFYMLKDRIDEESFCARNAKSANEAGRLCAVNTIWAEDVAYSVLEDLEDHRCWEGCYGYDDDMVRRQLDPIFVVAEEEAEEAAS